MSINQLRRRGTQGWQVLRRDGVGEVTRRSVRLASRRLGVHVQPLPLIADDIVDAAAVPPERPTIRKPGDQLTIGWLTVPPAAGSGGHTTMFRFVEALERAGHRCVLFCHDRYGNDVAGHEAVVRSWWPHIRAEMRDARDGIGGVDACFATSWPTAHLLARHGLNAGRRFYLVQDYEPFFYPRGAEQALAEDTYRFGFRCISVGHMVARYLRECHGVTCEVAEFGCDHETYRLTNRKARTGVAFYAKPDTARRGYQLAVMALDRLHQLRPDVPIYSFGMRPTKLPFPVEANRHLPPARLAEIYNECVAGLVLSFTNVSLAAQELLACGAIPVMNESADVRSDLDNRYVRWVRPFPDALAAALVEAVDDPPSGSRLVDISQSVARLDWGRSQHVLVRAVEDACWQPV
jgi:O-antigen biosynthesis protein